jgi:ABC-type phosphate transport system substrate-binding protein
MTSCLKFHRSLQLATAVLLLWLSVSPLHGAPETGEPLALLVHPQTPVENITAEQLTRIFLAEQQFWPGSHRITLLIRAPESPLRTAVLEQIYHMSEQEFRKYWISKMFKAEVASGPRMVFTADMAISLVSAIPGAVAFVPLSSVPPGAKILKINGLLPGDEGYALAM